jgi:membrane protein DedA with SNARE-associated domain
LIEELIESFGYWFVFLGTMLEGEAVLVLGGFAAHRGYLSLPAVLAIGYLGALVSDQIAFQLGRRRGATWLEGRSWGPRVERCRRLTERFGTPLILGFRFLYGLRTVLPFVWGTGEISSLRFFLLDLVGAGLWALAVGIAGYAFGDTAERVLGEVEQYEGLLALVIVTVGLGFWLYRRHWSTRLAADAG